jgi:hypothetical protein
MTPYLPWWLAALALAVVTVGCCVVARRPLGISGILGRFVNFREERAAEVEREQLARADDAALEAAFLAATADAFGPALASAGGAPELAPSPALATAALAPAAAEVPERAHACGRGGCAAAAARPTLGAHATFLVAIVAGGFVAQRLRGGAPLSLDLGPTFAAVIGTGWRGLLALALGGVLVGVGTTLSGGCSTGHGLSGLSRLQPAGIAATASFLASAVLVSLALAGSVP